MLAAHIPRCAALTCPHARSPPRRPASSRLQACSLARQVALAGSAEEQRRLEEDSCGLFFRVAAVFAQAAAFPGQAQAVMTCVQQMLGDMSQGREAVGEGAQVRAARAAPAVECPGLCALEACPMAARAAGRARGDNPRERCSNDYPNPLPHLATLHAMQAAELQYYECLSTMYERMGRYHAAARFALAAACQASVGAGRVARPWGGSGGKSTTRAAESSAG